MAASLNAEDPEQRAYANRMEDASESERLKSVYSAYMKGQLSNVSKAAVWWSAFGILAEALTCVPLAIGYSRFVFNMALILVSPIAGVLAETYSIQTLLSVTTSARLLLWCFAIPAVWILTGAYEMSWLFVPWFLGFMFFDGFQPIFVNFFGISLNTIRIFALFFFDVLVAFSNIRDIDCGGLSCLAEEYDLELDAQLYERFNRIHQIMFDASFIFLTPPVALLVWLIACRQPCIAFRWLGSSCDRKDVLFLLMGISVVFGFLSVCSLWNYKKLGRLKAAEPSRNLELELEREESVESGSNSDNLSIDNTALQGGNIRNTKPLLQSMVDRFRDIKDGFSNMLSERPLGWRLLLLSFETALEDAMVSVILPFVSLNMAPTLWNVYQNSSPAASFSASETLLLQSGAVQQLPGTWTFIHLFTVVLIALGKIGGLLAATATRSQWSCFLSLSSPQSRTAYATLFRLALLSSLCVLLLPVSYWILHHPVVFVEWRMVTTAAAAQKCAVYLCLSLLGIASFFFFLFVTAPKLGFATLLQSLVTRRKVNLNVFAFIETFVTLTDAAVIWGLNWILVFLQPEQFQTSLWVVAAVYSIHGLHESIIGPIFILDAAREAPPLDTTEVESIHRVDSSHCTNSNTLTPAYPPCAEASSQTSSVLNAFRQTRPAPCSTSNAFSNSALDVLESLMPNSGAISTTPADVSRPSTGSWADTLRH